MKGESLGRLSGRGKEGESEGRQGELGTEGHPQTYRCYVLAIPFLNL